MPPKIVDPRTGAELSFRYTDALLKELQALSENDCQHPRQELRRASTRGGGHQLRSQCLDCGELIGNAISTKGTSKDVPQADTELRDRQQQKSDNDRNAILLKHARIQHAEARMDGEWYAGYMKSEKWAEKRQKVMARARHLCEGCMERDAKVVHHLTYEHIGDELLFELVALCPDCHARCHPERNPDAAKKEGGANKDEDDPDAPWHESRCNACRWGGGWEGSIEWCGYLDIPAHDAQAGEDECAKVKEPLK